MREMQQAKEQVRKTLGDVKAFLNQEAPPRISEADTKANFIEPIIQAFGWSGIGVVTREYYVKNSQEFIDYVMSGPSGLLLAIEAKALLTDLTEKNAAQLIQYCAVEGIEWAALTNGRELQFFNTFLKPDLAAKRILSLDLLAYNSDAEFDSLFDQCWLLSRESMTTPAGVRSWLDQRRLDTALRTILLNPGSSTIRQLRRALSDVDVRATPQDLTQWFRSHLGSPITTISARSPRATVPTLIEDLPVRTRTAPRASSHGDLESVAGSGDELLRALTSAVDERWPDTRWRTTRYYVAAEHGGETFLACRVRRNWLILGLALPSNIGDPKLAANHGEFNWKRITYTLRVNSSPDISEHLFSLIEGARSHATATQRRNTFYGVELRDLISTGYLTPGISLALKAGARDVATATLTADGEVKWEGKVYHSLSDKAFARLLGPTRISLNGWLHWYALLPTGAERLADIRERYRADQMIGQAG